MKMKLGAKIGLIITTLIIVLTGLFAYEYSDKIYLFYRDKILGETKNIVIEKNEYFKDNNYLYIQNTNDFVAKDKKHLLNIIYTIINSGNDKFTFYCDSNYKLCINDFQDMINDQTILSNINNFVNPYNSYKRITATYDTYGKIAIELEKLYSKDDIVNINNKVNSIINDVITNEMSDKEKISTIHDYIINNGKYNTSEDNTKYNKASDILINGSGVCSAYADSLAIILDKLGIDNYKVASENHIWNLVYINDSWLHVDLTWDDPVTEDGKNHLERTTLLITNERLKQIDRKEHNFDTSIYVEAR